MAKVSRRQVMHGGSALLVGSAFESSAQGAARSTLRADVCVIGAGYAGLTAAYRLKQAGRKVIVLEARNRVGRRSLTAPVQRGAGSI
jgi:NADPH-dependent 2,4-dienoyl-CoA reductase/sulfur reductase-like enzyme